MLLGGSVSPWRSGVEEGRSPLGRFRKPEPCFPRTYATWDAKKDENRFESMKFRIGRCDFVLATAGDLGGHVEFQVGNAARQTAERPLADGTKQVERLIVNAELLQATQIGLGTPRIVGPVAAVIR